MRPKDYKQCNGDKYLHGNVTHPSYSALITPSYIIYKLPATEIMRADYNNWSRVMIELDHPVQFKTNEEGKLQIVPSFIISLLQFSVSLLVV